MAKVLTRQEHCYHDLIEERCFPSQPSSSPAAPHKHLCDERTAPRHTENKREAKGKEDAPVIGWCCACPGEGESWSEY